MERLWEGFEPVSMDARPLRLEEKAAEGTAWLERLLNPKGRQL